jgi:hypothetical protein
MILDALAEKEKRFEALRTNRQSQAEALESGTQAQRTNNMEHDTQLACKTQRSREDMYRTRRNEPERSTEERRATARAHAPTASPCTLCTFQLKGVAIPASLSVHRNSPFHFYVLPLLPRFLLRASLDFLARFIFSSLVFFIDASLRAQLHIFHIFTIVTTAGVTNIVKCL